MVVTAEDSILATTATEAALLEAIHVVELL